MSRAGGTAMTGLIPGSQRLSAQQRGLVTAEDQPCDWRDEVRSSAPLGRDSRRLGIVSSRTTANAAIMAIHGPCSWLALAIRASAPASIDTVTSRASRQPASRRLLDFDYLSR